MKHDEWNDRFDNHVLAGGFKHAFPTSSKLRGLTCRGGPAEPLRLLPFVHLSLTEDFQVADQLLQGVGEGVIVVFAPEVDHLVFQIEEEQAVCSHHQLPFLL
jgi:hypothetical protein